MKAKNLLLFSLAALIVVLAVATFAKSAGFREGINAHAALAMQNPPRFSCSGSREVLYVRPALAEELNGHFYRAERRMVVPWEPVEVLNRNRDNVDVLFCADGFEQVLAYSWLSSTRP